MFNEEWKLNAHKKTHRTHVCGECEETFKFEDILEKHKAIKHGNLRIFCSFFNNELECPHGEKCVFLHEHSDKCKYGEACERNNCMYKHKKDTTMGDDDEKEEVEDNGENETDEEENENSEDESVNNDNDDECENTFYNPSQSEDEKSDAKSDIEEITESELVKCELCIFETKDEKRIKRHTFENHCGKGKYMCIGCKREFGTRKFF